MENNMASSSTFPRESKATLDNKGDDNKIEQELDDYCKIYMREINYLSFILRNSKKAIQNLKEQKKNSHEKNQWNNQKEKSYKIDTAKYQIDQLEALCDLLHIQNILFEKLPQLKDVFNKDFLISDLWYLFIDGKKHGKNNPMIFDIDDREGHQGEPGYHNAMFKSFLFMLASKDFPLNISLISTFHRLATNEVGFSDDLSWATGIKKSGQHQGFRVSSKLIVSFGMLESNSSLAGLKEINELYTDYVKISTENYYPHVEDSDEIWKNVCDKKGDNYARFDAKYFKTDSIPTTLKLFIEKYQFNIGTTTSIKEKILALANFIHKCDLIHPFTDGNIRTFAMITLNHQLALMGLPLCISYDPNCFDGFSGKELQKKIVQGMQTFTHKFPSYKPKIPLEAVLSEFSAEEESKVVIVVEERKEDNTDSTDAKFLQAGAINRERLELILKSIHPSEVTSTNLIAILRVYCELDQKHGFLGKLFSTHSKDSRDIVAKQLLIFLEKSNQVNLTELTNLTFLPLSDEKSMLRKIILRFIHIPELEILKSELAKHKKSNEFKP